ncbi:MAG: translation initiation factor IF-3 [Cellulomonas sp.]|uniref:translation initiation factor IF-3 n=1 Tax=Cellulomonas sp. TaxID=40001 RepID=UPI002585E9A5|nr:translation initiation factor IF-3 [Cellulomonas sp.]MCR6705984.1 translation initiation factor IF-3 [Cellulomonas sp.]
MSEPRINDRIRVAEVRLVGPAGEQVGIVRVEDALRLAQDADLDLVEVAPEARPPVVKIMDYGKYKYEADMKAREARRNQANTVLKEIRFRLKIDPHDYATKKGHVERFLKAGDKVKVMIMFRGREQSRPEMGFRLLQRLAADVAELGFVESSPKQDGRNMIMVIGPNKKKAEQRQEQRRQAQAAAAREANAKAADEQRAAAAEPVAAEPVAETAAVEMPEAAATEAAATEAAVTETAATDTAVAEPAVAEAAAETVAEPAVEEPVAEAPTAAVKPAAAPRPAAAPKAAAPRPSAAKAAAAKPAAAKPVAAPKPVSAPKPVATPKPSAAAAKPAAPRPAPGPSRAPPTDITTAGTPDGPADTTSRTNPCDANDKETRQPCRRTRRTPVPRSASA